MDLSDISKLDALNKIYLHWKINFLRRAHHYQIVPSNEAMKIFLLLAGRGSGKTYAAASGLFTWMWETPGSHSLVLAPTANDIRSTCFNGDSGLLSVIPYELIETYNKSTFELTLKNGSTTRGVPAVAYERIRGGNYHYCWCDELAAFEYPQEAWDQAQFALRLGAALTIVSTTPKAIPLVAELVKRSENPNGEVIMRRVSSYANLANLAGSFAKQIRAYEGTDLGRQEIHAEIIDLTESGVIKSSWINKWPYGEPLPIINYVIYSLDTAFTEKTSAVGDRDYTAMSCWGIFYNPKTGCDNTILLDCWQDQLGVPALVERVRKELRFAWGATEYQDLGGKPLVGEYQISSSNGRKADLCLIENIGSGMAVRQVLAEYSIKTYPYQPKESKIARLHAASTAFASGLIWIPSNAENQFVSWSNEMMRQITQYCGEGSLAHDDFVDSVSQCVLYMQQKSLIGERVEQERRRSTPRQAYA